MTTTMMIGGRPFQTSGRTYLMGILNVTPDSFSDGGRWTQPDQALRHVEEMLRDGMDVLDIGGESTRPGHADISPQEEMERVLPILEAVRAHFDVPISLDTSKSQVAEAGIAAGAAMINDVWGLKKDPDMAAVLARHSLPCCLMHNRPEPDYGIFLVDLLRDLEESLGLARAAGISEDQIILDPGIGIGFGKRFDQNLEVIDRLDELSALGYPLLLGASRKSVIGQALHLPVEQRLEGTLVTSVFAVLKGCMFVRVHDIAANARAVRMAEAIRYGY